MAAMAAVGFTSCDDDDDNVIVINDDPVLDIVASTGNKFDGEGGTLQILVNSNLDYDVVIDADWIVRQVARSAAVNDVETFQVMPYPIAKDMTPRTATVTITSPDAEPLVYTVEQTPQDIYRFEVTGVSASYISSSGGTLTVSISSTVDYTYDVSDASWISEAEGSNSDTRVFTIAANDTESNRTGYITFHPTDLPDESVEFAQNSMSNAGNEIVVTFAGYVYTGDIENVVEYKDGSTSTSVNDQIFDVGNACSFVFTKNDPSAAITYINPAGSKPHLQWGKNSTLAFIPKDGVTLTKIVFHCTTGNYVGIMSVSEGECVRDSKAMTATWTGNASLDDVYFGYESSSGTYSMRIMYMEITYDM